MMILKKNIWFKELIDNFRAFLFSFLFNNHFELRVFNFKLKRTNKRLNVFLKINPFKCLFKVWLAVLGANCNVFSFFLNSISF